MGRLLPFVRPQHEPDDGPYSGEPHEQPVEGKPDQRREFAAPAAQPEGPSRQETHRHVAGDEVEEVEAEHGGAEGIAVPKAGGVDGERGDGGEIDGMHQCRHDHPEAEDVEGDELAKPELAGEADRLAHVHEPGLDPALVYLFAAIRCRPAACILCW